MFKGLYKQALVKLTPHEKNESLETVLERAVDAGVCILEMRGSGLWVKPRHDPVATVEQIFCFNSALMTVNAKNKANRRTGRGANPETNEKTSFEFQNLETSTCRHGTVVQYSSKYSDDCCFRLLRPRNLVLPRVVEQQVVFKQWLVSMENIRRQSQH